MASIISTIGTLTGAGILADRTTRSPALNFRRYNLIYGFNGSGKSTLSRLFASVQANERDKKLPGMCAFELLLDDDVTLSCPGNLSGLERRVLVFNADFIEHNLQWSVGRANPVFYIGREQAELAAELSKQEAAVPAAQLRQTNATSLCRAKEKAFATFKRERAKVVAESLRLRNRKYEAPQLVKDFDTLGGTILTEQKLEEAKATCRLDEPMPRVTELAFDESVIAQFVERTRVLALETPGASVVSGLEAHPEMVGWMKEGIEYHNSLHLADCLFCGSRIDPMRRDQLARAFDDRLGRFLASIDSARNEGLQVGSALTALQLNMPTSTAVSADLRGLLADARARLQEAVNACEHSIARTLKVISEKVLKPTHVADVSSLPARNHLALTVTELADALRGLNRLLHAHNERVQDFAKHQEEAHVAVRKHYVAEGLTEYLALRSEQDAAEAEAASAAADLEHLVREVDRLRSEVREHGPAAEKMNALIRSYLGHAELTISAISEGYEIHRHGRLVDGPPSEGEKTAIALCYFISTLESDGRKLKDLIVVVDDPISSLDTKALNFACALVRSRLEGAAQLFVLTHNQQCMNEFKKAWKGRYRPVDKDKSPTASFFFMDAKIPKGESGRRTTFEEMSKLLRDYDFEYHFLFGHVLRFEKDSDPDFEYGYMMPNVLRRVLDVFLAFRCPGSSGLAPKIVQLCKDHPELDKDRLTALERLAQVESHSENLDDLVGFSSMTIEEARDANAALLAMMEVVDPLHLKHLRRICAE